MILYKHHMISIKMKQTKYAKTTRGINLGYIHLHSERGIQVSCRIEHPMIKFKIFQLLMNEEEHNSLKNKWQLANKITTSLNLQETKIHLSECKATEGTEQRMQEGFQEGIRKL